MMRADGLERGACDGFDRVTIGAGWAGLICEMVYDMERPHDLMGRNGFLCDGNARIPFTHVRSLHCRADRKTDIRASTWTWNVVLFVICARPCRR